MKPQILRSNERGHASHGWLDTYHTFSFGEYHNPHQMGYRSLRVINDDLVMPARGFATHPHKDMEIISYILSGQLAHKDSMGNGRTIKAGEFQYMSAGSGVRHSEFNPSHEEATRLLQIWILPDQHGVTPRYAEKSFAEAPTGTFHLVASKTGRENSIPIHQDADLWFAKLDPEQTITHTINPNRHAWLHIAEGEVTLDDHTTLREGDAAAIDYQHTLHIKSTQPSQILLFDLA
ncbi:pirin family protein [Phragmitibacter flavus]|uniref:Pirin family protein n=1 Tax=Phragmitibacter flavus TaxID=2576071 RepID=A0A5R8KKH4_9BACT|nr:pirin family protein [Phragmitibacter flavus]TLD72445.1 pirin family protein [Phragmitibacter flavus]